MIESDQSDKETQNEVSPLEASNNSVNTNEPGQKRLREETSEDEKFDLPSKKLCPSVDETSKKHDIENISEVNGIGKGVEESAVDISTDNKEDEMKSVLEESKNETAKESYVATSEIKIEEAPVNNDDEVKKENESNTLIGIKQKENISMESVTNANTKDETMKEEIEEEEEEEDEDKIESKKERRKSQIKDAEVVEGLELSVECASDKESSSSSESEDGKTKKPMPKTIIIKAKPNDSELDVSSSEADKSDSQNISETKPKQTSKKGRKRGRTSFSKSKNTDSEENNDDVSDEDYSPRTKKKLKKGIANKKSTKSPAESKRGRGGVKRGTKKSLKKEDEEDENSNITEDIKIEENVSDAESVKSKSEDESDSEDTSKDGKRKKNTGPEDNKKIQLLKKYIRLAGIHVKSYNDLWASCKSTTAKIKCLKELLIKNGVDGRPTVEKCKKAKERNESLKDVAELNTSNIISEGRITRAQRNKDSNKELITPETPTKYRETRNKFKRVLNVIDSDSE